MQKYIIILLAIMLIPAVSSAADTIKTSSGLKYIVLKRGTGPKAELNKMAEVHYEGFLKSDGKRFDSSRRRQTPLEFHLGAGHVIKGWEEGVALMRIGDHFKFFIPPHLAYGEKGIKGVIPGNETLIFDVELLGISEPKKSLSDTLYTIISMSGIDAGKAAYEDIKINNADAFNMKETELNGLGYKFLGETKYKDALEVLKWNAAAYPESFNVYDSLGEAFMLLGNKEEAILNYEKSIEINPDNTNGKKMLELLKQ